MRKCGESEVHMRRTTLILSALVLGLPPLTALAQSVEIEKALLAAPPTMRENAMVIKLSLIHI